MLSSQEVTEAQFMINEETTVSNSEEHSSLNEDEQIPKDEYIAICYT